jgi:transcriptional regulator with XRE-family HTH domain
VEGDLQRTVGRNLRSYRVHRGLSQEAFADVLGMHRTYLGAIERGERNLTFKSLERIADKIELGALTLLLPEEAESMPAPGDRRLTQALAHPIRAQILSQLNKGPMAPLELATALEAPLANVEYHYLVLVELGVIVAPKS